MLRGLWPVVRRTHRPNYGLYASLIRVRPCASAFALFYPHQVGTERDVPHYLFCRGAARRRRSSTQYEVGIRLRLIALEAALFKAWKWSAAR
jgi:hypothetical protein